MRKRNLKKTILAAALAVPVAFSYPGWAVRAQEDEKVSTETEAQEVMQDNTAPEEAECEENPAHDEMDGAETDSTETDSTEADRNVSEEEKFFQSGLIANEDGEFLSSLEEMETSGEDSMFFQDGLEVLEDGSTDDLIDAYVALQDNLTGMRCCSMFSTRFNRPKNSIAFPKTFHKSFFRSGFWPPARWLF